jgi:ribosomal protein S18 acetylase RimI-like enzyme
LANFAGVDFRPASSFDAEDIGGLHADSWRRHYRGAYADSFLDGDVVADRLAIWTDRLAAADSRCLTIVAEDQQRLVGFAHVVFDDDPRWGSLLDNLHVVYERKRRGIGSRLLELSAEAVTRRPGRGGLNLWVLEQNLDAQAFYKARGGQRVGRRLVSPPGGIPSRLSGSPWGLRYAWSDPSLLTG